MRLLERIEQGERWLKFALFHLVEIGAKHRHGCQRPGMRTHKTGGFPLRVGGRLVEQAQAEVGDKVVVVAALDAHLAQSVGIA